MQKEGGFDVIGEAYFIDDFLYKIMCWFLKGMQKETVLKERASMKIITSDLTCPII